MFLRDDDSGRADGMVMIEHVNISMNIPSQYMILLRLEMGLSAGDDVKKGEHILSKGKLKPQDIGFLAAVGIAEINVFRNRK